MDYSSVSYVSLPEGKYLPRQPWIHRAEYNMVSLVQDTIDLLLSSWAVIAPWVV